MQFCNSCKVRVRGNRTNCPLCGNIFLKNDNKISNNELNDVYPKISPTIQSHLAIRIMLFISAVAIILSFAVYFVIPRPTINWPMFVLFGLLSAWMSLFWGIRKRHNITKNIMWQVLIISLLSVIWDFFMGWRKWSLEFVIPAVSVAAMLAMYVIAKVMKLSIRDYIAYFLLDCVFGIIPLLFILFNWIDFIFPSVICVTISLIFLFALVIFQGDSIKNELKKRMHI